MAPVLQRDANRRAMARCHGTMPTASPCHGAMPTLPLHQGEMPTTPGLLDPPRSELALVCLLAMSSDVPQSRPRGTSFTSSPQRQNGVERGKISLRTKDLLYIPISTPSQNTAELLPQRIPPWG